MSDDDEDQTPHVHVLGAFDPIGSMLSTLNSFMHLVVTFEENPDAMPPKEFLRAAHTAHETLEAILFVTFSTLMRSANEHIDDAVKNEHFREVRELKENRTPEEQLTHTMNLLSRLMHAIELPDLADTLPDFIPDGFLDNVEAGAGVDAMRAALAKALGQTAEPVKPDLTKLGPDEPAHPCPLCEKNELVKVAESGVHDAWRCSCGFTHTSEDCCDRRS